jgi:hypothetical protein
MVEKNHGYRINRDHRFWFRHLGGPRYLPGRALVRGKEAPEGACSSGPCREIVHVCFTESMSLSFQAC